MTKNEISQFKRLLEAKRAEVAHGLRNRDEIAIEKSADEIDEVQRAAECEVAMTKLDRESDLLRNIRAALRRIAEGAFGICAHCETEISRKRLEALPWAPLCIRCQEAADRGEEKTAETLERLLLSAA